ncbi:MAG: hypothetical protein ACFE9C_07435 [Candidatus Hodarchaeota archaeon]
MELIKDRLLNNENILWENHHYSKFDQRYSFSIDILMILFFNIIFFILLGELVIYLFSFLLAGNLIFPFMILSHVYTFLRDKKKGQLKWKDFKKYHMFAILTNKRWIQKDLNVIYIKDTDDLAKSVEHYKDIVFIKLESIKLIEITERKELGKWKYFISCYFSYDKKKSEKNEFGTYFSSKIQNQILFDNFHTLIKPKHEEIDQIRKNHKIFKFYY